MFQQDLSGAKVFAGEDLDAGDRRIKQQWQTKQWLEQQMAEKQRKLQEQKEQERREAEEQRQTNQIWQELEEERNRRKNEIEKATKDSNLQLIIDKRSRDMNENNYQEQMGTFDQNYTLTSNFMTENTQTCSSSLAKHRVIPYHWKGMSREQLKEIYAEQARQVEENKMRSQMNKYEEKMYADQLEQQRKNIIKSEQQFLRLKKQVNEDNRDYIKTQQIEHKLKYNDPYNEKDKEFLIRP